MRKKGEPEMERAALSVKSFATASALVWAIAVFFVGVINMNHPTYGFAFLEMVGSVYPGYEVTGTPSSVAVGMLYAAFDGAIGEALFAWIYNRSLGFRRK